ncbi:ABC transporter permease, partial [Pyxidicoccus sp. 3LFB2]
METLLQDVRFALRTLARSPGFTLVAVLALALGIGANSAVFSVVNGVLLKAPPFAEPDRLVHLWGNFHKANLTDISVSVPEYRDYRVLPRVFASVAAFDTGDATLTGGDVPERLSVTTATASYFPTLGVSLARGRAFTEDEETPGRERVLVLTHKAWRSRFAQDEGVLAARSSSTGTRTRWWRAAARSRVPGGHGCVRALAPRRSRPRMSVAGAGPQRAGSVEAGSDAGGARTDLARVASEMERTHEN